MLYSNQEIKQVNVIFLNAWGVYDIDIKVNGLSDISSMNNYFVKLNAMYVYKINLNLHIQKSKAIYKQKRVNLYNININYVKQGLYITCQFIFMYFCFEQIKSN